MHPTYEHGPGRSGEGLKPIGPGTPERPRITIQLQGKMLYTGMAHVDADMFRPHVEISHIGNRDFPAGGKPQSRFKEKSKRPDRRQRK